MLGVFLDRDSAVEHRDGRLALSALLPCVDVLSLHCPLTPETYQPISAPEPALMRHDAVLINTARGGLADENALANALHQGALAGAGIDVPSTAPPVAGNPLPAADSPNLIITPHSARGSCESRPRLAGQPVENIHHYLDGAPTRVVH
ncbi:MAG: hypothetical protein CSA09_00640 [Candidatus Contendobacter odensis]|uniref:D-isomer specific 2-hydroxyacid dehydrogenase NAD-binding domain-containing protein n=1 Tax=Candidatus Contendibacter odensensis TaxID=1400860 RepID=A0A2G6PGW4_9GAMM|nr:MAG: hypothetical protein CSA09_00640 [Candidatus Contendobacter odensis]